MIRGTLVLSRKVGHQTIINDDLVITIREVRGNWVSLGFTELTQKQYTIVRPEAVHKCPAKKASST